MATMKDLRELGADVLRRSAELKLLHKAEREVAAAVSHAREFVPPFDGKASHTEFEMREMGAALGKQLTQV
jgi:hypothetical protein